MAFNTDPPFPLVEINHLVVKSLSSSSLPQICELFVYVPISCCTPLGYLGCCLCERLSSQGLAGSPWFDMFSWWKTNCLSSHLRLLRCHRIHALGDKGTSWVVLEGEPYWIWSISWVPCSLGLDFQLLKIWTCEIDLSDIRKCGTRKIWRFKPLENQLVLKPIQKPFKTH